MFILNTNAKSVDTLLEIMSFYEQSSGQMINTNKFSISFSSKTPIEIRNRVKQTLGIDKVDGVGKYLGLDEHFGAFTNTLGRRKNIFSHLLWTAFDKEQLDGQTAFSPLRKAYYAQSSPYGHLYSP